MFKSERVEVKNGAVRAFIATQRPLFAANTRFPELIITSTLFGRACGPLELLEHGAGGWLSRWMEAVVEAVVDAVSTVTYQC